MICDFNTQQLTCAIDSLKERYGRLVTNSFRNIALENCDNWRVVPGKKAVMIVISEPQVVRLEFYAAGMEDLNELFDELDPGEYCIDYLYRKKNEFAGLFQSLGLKLNRTMQRYHVLDVSTVLSAGDSMINKYRPIMEYKSLDGSEFELIKNLLWTAFDTRISHIPDDEILRKNIADGEFLGIIKGSELTTLLQRRIKNSKFYINQVINNAQPEYIHSIMIGELERYVQNGGNYVYSWIATDNEASIRFHRKYGMVPDVLMYDNLLLCK